MKLQNKTLLSIFFYFFLTAYSNKLSAQQTCTGGGDQVTYGSGSWIGYVYDGTAFNTYRGFVTETQNFTRNFGNNANARPGCSLNGGDNFTIRYLMKLNNLPAGVYRFTVGNDDGKRLVVSPTQITNFSSLNYLINAWSCGCGDFQGAYEHSGGDLYLIFEYYEATGGAQSNFSMCYEGPLQDYGTTNWNGYYYNTTNSSYPTTTYVGKLSSGYYTSNTLSDLNRVTGTSAPGIDAAPSGTTACSGTAATNFATRYLLKNNFTRSFYLFTINSDDGVRVSTQGPSTWTLGSTPSSWDIFNNWGTSGTYSNQNISALLEGNTNLVVEHGQGGGNYLLRNQICQMNGNYTFGTFPIWNAYAFNSSTIDLKTYAAWYQNTSSGTTMIDNNFVNAIPSNSISGISGFTLGGCTGTPTLNAGGFAVRYMTKQTFSGARGIYAFSAVNNDDGRRLYISDNPDQSTLLYDNLSSGSGDTKYTSMIEPGDKYLTFDFRAGGTPNRAALQQCKMAGNYTYNTYPTWNAYAFNRTDLPNNNFKDINSYAGVYTTSASGTTLIDNNWGDCGTCHPRGATGSLGVFTNADYGGCSGAPATTENNFSVRYLSSRTYASPGVWVFETRSTFGGGSNNDDGRRLFIDYNNSTNIIGSSPTQLFDAYGSGSGLTTSSPTLIPTGTHGLIYDFREGTGGARAAISECQMSGGDLTSYGLGSWNVYVYNAGDYNFTTDNYRGFFTSGSANSTSASFGNLTDVNVANNRTGACGTAHSSNSSNQSIRAILTNNFNKGVYDVSVGADDNYRLSLDGGTTFPFTGGCCAGVTGSAALNGTTNLVYQGNNSGGSGAVYRASVNCASAVLGTLSSNQSCNGTGSVTLSWSGGKGYYLLESSTDYTTWTTVSGYSEANTVASSSGTWTQDPSVTTFYRVRIESCNGTPVYSNVVAIQRSGTISGNVVVTSNITLGGTVNISGDFTLNSGNTITLQQGCPLVINAKNITINGTIDGTGKGYTGATGTVAGGQDWSNATRVCGGGGAGINGAGPSGTNGTDGFSGSNGNRQGRGGSCNVGCCPSQNCNSNEKNGYGNGGGGGGGGAGGTYGGSGGTGGYGARGGWFNAPDWSGSNDINNAGGTAGNGGTAKTLYGTNTGTDIDMGSGGGSGGGGGGAFNSGGNGAAGGNGGGAVSLIACNALTVNNGATIKMDGSPGNNGGGRGGDENDNSNNLTPDGYNWFQCGYVISDNCVGNYVLSGGSGGGSGGGAGGGILLQAFGPVTINSSAVITAKGGNGGTVDGYPSTNNANNQSGKSWGVGGVNNNRTATIYGYWNAQNGAGGGGGRIKVVFNPCQTNSVTIASTAVDGGLGGTGGGATANGNNGGGGNINPAINHPKYVALSPGTISTSSYAICYGTNPSTGLTASTPTGGANSTDASLSACASSFPAYQYQWYVTKTLCASPTTGTGSGSSWSPIAINGGATSKDLSTSQVLDGINTVGATNSPNTYCFQRRDQSGGTAPGTGGCYAWTNTVSVYVTPDFSSGSLSNSSQTICNNTQPSDITYSSSPGGTALTGQVITYRWYKQTGNISCPSGIWSAGSWSLVSTSTSSSILTGTTIGNLTATTTFALRITSVVNGNTTCYDNWTGNCHVVYVSPGSSSGTLASSSQTICNNTQPSDITYSFAPGGTATTGEVITYQWYQQTGTPSCPTGNWASGGGWSPIGTPSTSTPTLTGADIGSLSATTTFALRITSVINGSITCYDKWTGTCHVIYVNAGSSSGTLASASQTICYNTQPANITYSVIPGGTAITGEVITYRWYKQTGNIGCPSGAWSAGSWSLVSTSTSSSSLSGASIGNLTATTTFALRITSVVGGSTACYDDWAGNCHLVTVLPILDFGTVDAGDQSVCTGGDPDNIIISTPSGANGTFNYQWYSIAGVGGTCPSGTPPGSWSLIGGATSSSYDPPSGILGSTTYAVTIDPTGTPDCATPAWASSCRKVTVVPIPTSGTLTITPNSANVCDGANVSAAATSGTGGTGTITDILEYRTNDGTGFTSWAAYTSGTNISTTGLVAVEIQTYRTATGSGCTTSTANTVSWAVNPQPIAGTLAKTPNTIKACEGTLVSAVLTAGSGGSGTITDVLQYRFNGTGSWSTYTSGANISTTGKDSVEVRTYRTASGLNCSTSDTTIVAWSIDPAPIATPVVDYIATCDATAQLSFTVTRSGTFSWAKQSGVGTPSTSSSNPLIVTGLTSGTTAVYRLLGSLPGCTNINMGDLSLPLPTNSSTTLTSTSSCAYCVITDGSSRTYYNNSGELIAKIEDDPAITPDNLDATEVCARINGSVQTILDNYGNLQPYLQRQWTIHPSNNTSSKVTLYFSNAELSALQSAANSTVYQFSGYQLGVTKYQGGQNGTFTPACTGGTPGCGQVTGEYVPAVFSQYGSNHKVEFNISTFSTFYIHPELYPFSPLPVELISFTGWNQGAVNRLQWITASEQNTARYEIQKSIIPSVWFSIGEKTGAGNSTQRLIYDFTDNNPIEGDNYYRLKIIDNNGAYSYSNVINIPLSEVVVNNFTRVYPNPTGGELNVEIQSTNIYDTKVLVYHVIGKKVFEKPYPLVKGLNTLQFDFSQLAKGTYLLQFPDKDGKLHTTKFVKD